MLHQIRKGEGCAQLGGQRAMVLRLPALLEPVAGAPGCPDAAQLRRRLSLAGRWTWRSTRNSWMDLAP